MVTTNQADVVVSIARGEVGRNLGGSKYWSWYGFPSRVEWCACFTSWCLHTAGVNCGDLRPNRNLTTNEQDAKDSTDITQFISEGRDALISKGCMQMKDFYNRKNCILSSSQLAKAGDIVLYDWDPEYYNDVDHVGIVEWVEGSSVSTQVLHVIEGNMSTTDNVGRRTISRTSSLIGVICRPTYRMVEDNGEIEFGPDESYYEEYIVTYGDTLGEIAISHGLTVDEVVAYNSITNANVITVGQVIKLPYNGRRSWIGEFQQATFSSLMGSPFTAMPTVAAEIPAFSASLPRLSLFFFSHASISIFVFADPPPIRIPGSARFL